MAGNAGRLLAASFSPSHTRVCVRGPGQGRRSADSRTADPSAGVARDHAVARSGRAWCARTGVTAQRRVLAERDRERVAPRRRKATDAGRSLLLASSEARRIVGPPDVMTVDPTAPLFRHAGTGEPLAPDASLDPLVAEAGRVPSRRPALLSAGSRGRTWARLSLLGEPDSLAVVAGALTKLPSVS